MVFYVKVVEALVKFKIKVRDRTTGDPIKGAVVTIYANGRSLGSKSTNEYGETDWFYANLNDWITGEVSKEGYVKVTISGFYATQDMDGKTITVYLTPEEVKGKLILKVIDIWNKPVKGAKVSIYDSASGMWISVGNTDEDGVVTTELAYGSYRIKAEHPTYGSKVQVITVDEKEEYATIVLGSERASIKFIIYHPVGAFWREPVQATVRLWCEETGYDQTKVATIQGDVAVADFGEVEANHTYKYRVEAEGYVPYESSIYAEKGMSYEIEVKMITEEEAKCPGWLGAIASLLGITCEQARMLVMGIVGLFIFALVLGIIF